MPRYEYKVIPAPAKGRKARGVKTPEARFALSVETVLNQMGAEGWEYQRAELLPSDERSGLTGTAVHWRNVLVFRRPLQSDAEAFAPRLLDAPAPLAETASTAGVPAEPAAPSPLSQAPEDPPIGEGARRMLKDDGVEEISEVSGMTAALKARAALRGKFSRGHGKDGDDDDD